MQRLVILLIVVSTSVSKAEPTCDKIWESIASGCLDIRKSIVTNASSPKIACCNNVKYNMCIKSAAAYATMAKLTKVCPDEVYDHRIETFQSPIDLLSTLCTNFNVQVCVTDPISNYWSQLSSQFNTKAISNSIENNFNSAVTQLTAIAKSVGQTINEQKIPERFAAGAESIRSTFNDGTRDISKAIAPNRDANRYSIVGEKDTSSGVDELVDSIFPSVEIVEKEPSKTTDPVKPENSNRFPFLDWFQTGFERASTVMKDIGKGATAVSTKETPNKSDNPYSTDSQ